MPTKKRIKQFLGDFLNSNDNLNDKDTQKNIKSKLMNVKQGYKI